MLGAPYFIQHHMGQCRAYFVFLQCSMNDTFMHDMYCISINKNSLYLNACFTVSDVTVVCFVCSPYLTAYLS